MAQRFHDWTFCDQLLSARSAAGDEIRFPRQERALLAKLIAAPHILHTRDGLLAALPRAGDADGDAESGTRHIDFLINRIRRRLGDTARNPRFIATQYGEGYLWIATPPPAIAPGTFVVLLPLHQQMPPAADALAQALCHALRDRIVRPHAASIAPHGWQPVPGDGPAYLLELSAYADAGTLHLALLLRDAQTRQPLHPLRVSCPAASAPADPVLQRSARTLAAQLHTHLWAHQALEPGPATPATQPLELRLHEATRLFGEQSATWHESLAYVEQLDGGERYRTPAADITRATTLFTRILQQAPHTQILDAAEWDALEEEIERLVLQHLPAIAGQPLLELAASRLLGSLGGRHAETAFGLARSGFAGTTAFAAAFSTLGQCHSQAGEFATAHALYDRAIELAEPRSEFHVYLLVLKCVACIGAGDLTSLAHCRATLFDAKPATRQEAGFVLYAPEPELPGDIAAVLPLLGEALLGQLLYLLQRNARNVFRNPTHQANLLRGPVRHLARYIGPHIIPAPLRPLL